MIEILGKTFSENGTKTYVVVIGSLPLVRRAMSVRKKKWFSVIGKLNRRILHFTRKLLMNVYFSSNFTITR